MHIYKPFFDNGDTVRLHNNSRLLKCQLIVSNKGGLTNKLALIADAFRFKCTSLCIPAMIKDICFLRGGNMDAAQQLTVC